MEEVMESIDTEGFEHIRVVPSIVSYYERRQPVGDFLTGMLEADLRKALSHASGDCLEQIRDIFIFIYNRLPSQCWGSKEKVKAWLAAKDPLHGVPGRYLTQAELDIEYSKRVLRNIPTVEGRMRFLADLQDIAAGKES